MRDTVFFKQAELLLRILPLIRREEVSVRPEKRHGDQFLYPRSSSYLSGHRPHIPSSKREGLCPGWDISHALIRISEAIKRLIPGTKIILKNIRGTNTLKGMIAENVTYEELETTRNDLRAIIRGELTLDESYKHYSLFYLELFIFRFTPFRSDPAKVCKTPK